MLVTFLGGCHEDARRKLLPWNFSLTRIQWTVLKNFSNCVNGVSCPSAYRCRWLTVHWRFMASTLQLTLVRQKESSVCCGQCGIQLNVCELMSLLVTAVVLRHVLQMCIYYSFNSIDQRWQEVGNNNWHLTMHSCLWSRCLQLHTKIDSLIMQHHH